MKIKYICARCKSDSVGEEAFCDWNVEKQRWEIANFTGEAFCHECADSTTLEEVKIGEEEHEEEESLAHWRAA